MSKRWETQLNSNFYKKYFIGIKLQDCIYGKTAFKAIKEQKTSQKQKVLESNFMKLYPIRSQIFNSLLELGEKQDKWFENRKFN